MVYYFITIITALILDRVFPGPSSNGRSKAKQMIPRNKELCDNGGSLRDRKGVGLDGRAGGRNGEWKRKGNCNQVLCEKKIYSIKGRKK